MFDKYDPTKHINMITDKQGFVRVLSHVGKYVSAKKGRDPGSAARDYLQEYGDLLGVRRQHLKSLLHPIEDEPTSAGIEYRFAHKKSQFDLTTVSFHQTRFGLPVWEAGISVTVKHGRAKQHALRVVGARSTLHHELRMRRPTAMSIARLKAIDAKTLAKSLGLSHGDATGARSLHMDNSKRLMIYRYEEEARRRHTTAQPPPHRSASSSEALGLPLPPVHRMIRDGQYYVVAAVYFSFGFPPGPPLHWAALVEAETLSVLLLRPFVAEVSGWVFQTDPVTLAGGPTANASSRSLNRLRRPVKLAGLKPPANGPQALSGRYVTVSDVILPNVAPPTRPAGRNFKFDARSNDFAAVNAYYNCDRVFRLVEHLGFSVRSYFGGTTFPIPVDHRGYFSQEPPTGIQINAHCAGTANGSGIEYTCFALADLDDVERPIGIACDWRTVLHELLGHGILYNHISYALLKFSHSAGDSFAAILNDVDSKAPDRGDTFPWIVGIPLDQRRRHDRTVCCGWGWGGEIALHPFDDAKDQRGYKNEQILSSTMFRFYRSIGGDAADIKMKRFAAKMVCHIMLLAIQTLTPETNPPDAAHFASALIRADLADWAQEGVTGGAYRKVIRWAFEKQGLYQPPDAVLPNDNPGAPPPVDIYLEDGRRGEYQYQANYDDCCVIWNRHRRDHGAIHEEPIAGIRNYAYVKIKNRGSETAREVVVRAFSSRKSTRLVYPNSWQPMRPAQRFAANVPPHSAGEIVVGPFEWVPRRQGDAALLMVVSAAGNSSNIDHFSGRDAIPNWRLVPHDNNIGQRTVRIVKKTSSRARRRQH